MLRHALALTALLCPLAAAAAPADTADRPAHRRYGDWTSSRIGGGGYILGTRFTSNPDRRWAWTDVGGAYRSDDAGDTWHNVTWTLPYGGSTGSRGLMYCRDLLADPDDPDRALIAVGYHWSPRYGVYRTNDAGATWERVLEAWFSGDDETRFFGSVLTRSPSDPDTVWAAAISDGVFLSRDDGETWRDVGGPSVQPSDLFVDPADPDRAWVAAKPLDAKYREDRANRPDGRTVLPGGLWRTDDAGESWKQLIGGESVANLAADPGRPGRIIAIRDDAHKVVASEDGGETWTPLMDGLNPYNPDANSHESPQAYSSFSEGADRLYLSSLKNDLFVLRPDGEGWEKLNIEEIQEPEDWWGATKDRPTYGTDWVNTFSAIASIDVNPHDPEELALTDWYSVYRSLDGGRTWANATEGIEVTYVDALEQDPSDPDVVHLGVADVGYFRSADGGESFRGLSVSNPITNNIKSISVPAANPDRVYALGPETPGGGWYACWPFRSDDGGLTWDVLPREGLPEMAGDAHRSHSILAVDDRPDTVFMVATGEIEPDAGGVYASRDGGGSWEGWSDGLPGGVEFFRRESWGGGHELAAAPNHTLLANSIEGARLFRRAAGDDAWSEVPFPADAGFNDVRADPHAPAGGPGRFYATGPGAGFFRSDDDGLTWRELSTPDAAPGPKQLIVDRVVPGRIALGTSFGVVLSRDAGEAWEVLDQRLPGRVDWNKGAFAGDRLVVGSGGVGCYWIDLASEGGGD